MNTMEYFVWGAKGHAKVLDEIIREKNGQVIAIFDRDSTLNSCIGLEVMHGLDKYIEWLSEIQDSKRRSIGAAVAIGGSHGKDRYEYYKLFNSDGFMTPVLVHPSSCYSKSAEIGSGSQICAFGFVGVDTRVGEACIINTKASIDHESKIGNGVHLGPGATICGNVIVDDFTFVGSGATVLPNISIGKSCIIGAGAVVVRDLPDNSKVKGVPAVAY